MFTLGGFPFETLNSASIETKYGLRLDNNTHDEKVPVVFPDMNTSSCSCDKCIPNMTLENFQTVTLSGDDEKEVRNCPICRNNLTNKCAYHSLDDSTELCKIVHGIKCSHTYHYCCITKWLKTRSVCPICNIDWKFFEIDYNKIIVYHEDKVYEFDATPSDDFLSQIGQKFGVDMNKFKLTCNKNYVDEYKPGRYALCTPDMHSGHNALKVCCRMGDHTENLFLKYSTRIDELKEELSKVFNILKDQVTVYYKGIEITNDMNNLNIFNLDFFSECEILVNACIQVEYKMDIDDIDSENKFVTLYPNCPLSGNTLQNAVCGKVSWLPEPFIRGTTKEELSCLLSSLYILNKKVNMNEDTVKFVCNKFKKFMDLYNVYHYQTKLAKKALETFLKLDGFNNKQRMILSCTFNELVFKMQEDSGMTDIKNPLLHSNVVCNLLLSLNPAQKINWKFALKDVQAEKTFNIYSPVVLTTGVPPLLTLDKHLNVAVFIGKGKDVSLPTILYNPLTDSEVDVNAAELAKIVTNKGATMLVDDRIYDEGIMICIDTSNSMNNCSDFYEDQQAKQKDKKEEEKEFFKIMDIPEVKNPEEGDMRLLKNTIIWFITHPNFNHWFSRRDQLCTVKNIILTEQSDNKEMTEIISKYFSLFVKLLQNNSVSVGGCSSSKYSHLRDKIKKEKEVDVSYKTDPPSEYLCPISQELMINPVLAKDGFTYDKDEIEEWFKTNSRSPLTGAKLKSKKLMENKTLRILINDWKNNNVVKSESNKKEDQTLEININDTEIKYKYNNTSNIWDLIYEIYRYTDLNHNNYSIISNYWTLEKNTLLKDIKNEIKVNMYENKEIVINLHENNSRFMTRQYKVPDTYSVKNLIYHIGKYSYYDCTLWKDLRDAGDGVLRGQLLSPSQRLSEFYSQEITLSSFNECRIDSKKHYLSRLDVVKKLFDAFINRSIAYSFNSSIGLMSFSNKSKLECDMTALYESFRDKIDDLEVDGATALYESLKDAAEKLVIWKNADLEKRGTAKLRVLCLTDGKDTGVSNIKSYVENIFKSQGIILDCIVIGDDYDNYIGNISKKTGGYMFNPSTIKYAQDIMELETVVSSKNRAQVNTWNGIIDEKSPPPFLQPDKEIRAKSLNIHTSLDKFKDSSKVLQKEIVNIMKDPHPFIDVYINDDDMYFWKVVFQGPDGTPYKNGTWLAYLQFSQSYPSVPPNIRFVTPIKHCNINNYGRVCHSILDRNYTPATKISTILNCIYGLLLNPDASDPLDTNMAMLYYEADGQYEAQIMDCVNQFARTTREEWNKKLV